jgi:hypothetical protein
LNSFEHAVHLGDCYVFIYCHEEKKINCGNYVIAEQAFSGSQPTVVERF